MRIKNESYEKFHLLYGMCYALLDRLRKDNALTDIQYKDRLNVLSKLPSDVEDTMIYLEQVYENLKSMYMKNRSYYRRQGEDC